jgi:ketosteroid isomerase-like protein
MNRDEAVEYTRRWTDAWNRLDVERVLEHFDADVVFSSPTALATVGVPTVRGKRALRDYWMTALQSVKSLRFTVVRVIWDPDASELAIIYDREVNGRDDRAAEILQFGLEGRVVRGEVLYGVRESQEALVATEVRGVLP